jgi:hypothetical protein
MLCICVAILIMGASGLKLGSLATEQQENKSFVNTSSFGKSIPVVYVWFGSNEFPDYFEETAKVSAMNNDVIAITENGQRFKSFLGSNIQYFDLKLYLTRDREFFDGGKHNGYQHWGKDEPWEQQNLQRAFALSEYMEQNKHYEHVFFADCDVAVLVNIAQVYYTNYATCGSVLSLERQTVKSHYWAAWIGSSILSRKVLADFVIFAKHMYSNQYVGVLQEKRIQNPFVCDMTIWYLFAAAAGVFPDAKEVLTLPQVSTTSMDLCAGQIPRNGGHFDHMAGFKLPGFHMNAIGHAFYQRDVDGWTQLYSLHFQGGNKNKIHILDALHLE